VILVRLEPPDKQVPMVNLEPKELLGIGERQEQRDRLG